MNGICGDDFKRRDATHFHFDVPVRGMNTVREMNPTATIGHRYAIQAVRSSAAVASATGEYVAPSPVSSVAMRRISILMRLSVG